MRNKTIQFVIILLLCTVSYISCNKKLGDNFSIEQNVKAISKFFTIPPSVPNSVLRVAKYLESENVKSGFANNLIHNVGMAIWDKAKVSSKVQYLRTTESISNEDTVVLIPLVLVNEDYVNGFLAATMNGNNIAVKLYEGEDYKNLVYGKTEGQIVTAEKVAMQIMSFDHTVFGYDEFTLTDKLLFKTDTQQPQTTSNLNKVGTVKFTDLITTAQARCTHLEVSWCDESDYCKINGCDWKNCGPNSCWGYVIDICSSIGGSDEGPSAGLGPNIGSGSTNLGGGGGDGSISNGSGGLGWEPIDDEERTRWIIDSLDGYPCAQEILRLFPTYNNEVKEIVNNSFNNNEDVNLIFNLDDSLINTHIDGYTKSIYKSTNRYGAKISLNPWVLRNSSKEYMLVTIFHESLHAYIKYSRYQLEYGKIDSVRFKTLFPLFWEYRRSLTTAELAEHNVMADKYVSNLKNLLFNFNPTITDSMATALAWGGLEQSTAWKNRSDTTWIKKFNYKARGMDTLINYNNINLTKCD